MNFTNNYHFFEIARLKFEVKKDIWLKFALKVEIRVSERLFHVHNFTERLLIAEWILGFQYEAHQVEQVLCPPPRREVLLIMNRIGKLEREKGQTIDKDIKLFSSISPIL